ncbi:MAG: hypothetical protein DRP29_01835 [Thermodesulfobacteriota bacterium]|nr:MAG: hypothetical protein DRP29_01835 [Thermodesulfobacteriota bacterium]
MWQYNPLTGKFEKVGLINVAPLCTISSNWKSSVSGEVLATGDGSQTHFTGTIDYQPVDPLDSFTIHYTIGGTTYDATADSDGNITGTHITSGTINQEGQYDITFDTPLDNGTDLTADYNHGISPANVENAFYPKYQPSDWGWRTCQGDCWHISIIFPSPGYYILRVVVEGCYTATGQKGDTSLTPYFVYTGIGNNPSPSFSLKQEPETRIQGWTSPIYSPDFDKCVICFYASALQTLKLRFRKIDVFRIA